MDPGLDPRATYRNGLDRERQAASDGRDQSRRLTALRAAVFAAFVACLILKDGGGHGGGRGAGLSGLREGTDWT